MKNKNEILRKILIINLIIVVGLVISYLVVEIKKASKIDTKPVLSDMVLHWDFYQVLMFAGGKLGEGAVGNYLPFAYVVMRVLGCIQFTNYKGIYYMVVELCVFIYVMYCRYFLKDKIERKAMYFNIIIFILMQFPFLFAFQRGNIELIVLAICMAFYILYKKEKYNLAAIVLSLAVCMKLYPALLAMLFISKKQYKSFFMCAGSSVVIAILSYLLVQDIFGGFSHYISGFTTFVEGLGGISGLQYNHSLLFAIYYIRYKILNIDILDVFSNSIMTGYTISIICLAIPLTLYTTFKKMEEWKKVTIFTLMIVSFPQISFDYTLLLLMIPIIAFVTDENTKKWENIVYSILFGLLLIPMNINEEIVKANVSGLIYEVAPNIGLLIRPIIIIAIMAMIIISSINMNKKINGKEQIIEA